MSMKKSPRATLSLIILFCATVSTFGQSQGNRI